MIDFQPSSRGRNGFFKGNNLNISNTGNQETYIVNEVNAYSAHQLARLHERVEGLPPLSVSRLAGLTIDFTTKSGEVTGFSAYRNFTARDVRSNSSTLAGVNAIVDKQIWELGNSLGNITGKHIAGDGKEEYVEHNPISLSDPSGLCADKNKAGRLLPGVIPQFG